MIQPFYTLDKSSILSMSVSLPCHHRSCHSSFSVQSQSKTHKILKYPSGYHPTCAAAKILTLGSCVLRSKLLSLPSMIPLTGSLPQ